MTVSRLGQWVERHRLRIVAVWMLAVLFVVGAVLFRLAGEPQRTKASVDRNTADIRMVIAQQEKEIRGDCPFKRRAALLPELSPKPTVALVDLATAARQAYIVKGCAAAGFGPVPPKFKAAP